MILKTYKSKGEATYKPIEIMKSQWLCGLLFVMDAHGQSDQALKYLNRRVKLI